MARMRCVQRYRVVREWVKSYLSPARIRWLFLASSQKEALEYLWVASIVPSSRMSWLEATSCKTGENRHAINVNVNDIQKRTRGIRLFSTERTKHGSFRSSPFHKTRVRSEEKIVRQGFCIVQFMTDINRKKIALGWGLKLHRKSDRITKYSLEMRDYQH